MHHFFQTGLKEVLDRELSAHFTEHLAAANPADVRALRKNILDAVQTTLDTQAIIMDIAPRMETSVAASSTPLVDFLCKSPTSVAGLEKIPLFRQKVAEQAISLSTLR